jgi:hypothetical protein
MEQELISFDNGLKLSQYIEPHFSMLTVWHDVPGLRRSVFSFYNLKEDQSKFISDYVKGLPTNLSYDEAKQIIELIK